MYDAPELKFQFGNIVFNEIRVIKNEGAGVLVNRRNL